MRQAFKIVFMALAMLGLATSCVKDDLSKCLPETPAPPPDEGGKIEARTLKLTFVPRQMDITPTQADLKLALVYIFDSSGAVFKTWTQSNPALNTVYDTGITLGTDTYRLVAWINPEAPYKLTTDPAPVSDTTSVVTPTPVRSTTRSALTDGRVTLTIPESGDVTEKIPMLFYGSKEQVLAPTSDVTVEIPLTLDTYDLSVTLKGIPLDGSVYRLQVNDTNGAYDFNNNYIETVGFDYQGFATAGTGGGTGDLVLNLRTLRLSSTRRPMISIVNMTTGTVVFPSGAGATGGSNLMELVNQTGIDLTTTYNINLELTATPPDVDGGTFFSTTVIINGWRVVLDGNGTVITNE